MTNPEHQAEVDNLEAYLARGKAEEAAECPYGEGCVLVLPHSPSECVGQPTSKKTNRAHARAELDLLRQQLADDAHMSRHIRVYVQRTVDTKADVLQVLEALKSVGMSRQVLDQLADIVWPTQGAAQ